jgi:hypothetical protein
MGTPGYVFRDGGTTPPAEENPDSEFRQRIIKAKKPVTATAQAPLGQNTSTSHQLATGENELVGGAVQKAGKEDRTTNLGWQANAVGVDQLVGGLPNDELWTLVRRFNKACINLLMQIAFAYYMSSKCIMSKRFRKQDLAALICILLMRMSSRLIN